MMRRSSRHRALGVCVLSATAATASCSLLFRTDGFDSHYDSGVDAPSHDGAHDGPPDAHSDRAADGPMETGPPTPTMPLFHYRRLTAGHGDAAVSRVEPGVAFLLDSGAAHAIGCPDKGTFPYFEPSLTLGVQALSNGPYRYGQLAMSAYRAPDAGRELAPGRSRFAFSQVIPDEDGGYDYPLLIADELTDCDASHPAVRVDPVKDLGNAGKAHVLPRFSPDGARVAYIDLVAEPSGGSPRSLTRVVTTGVDGLHPRLLRNVSSFNPATNLILWGLPPTWIPGLGVVWLDGPDPSCTRTYPSCGYAPFQLNYATDTQTPTMGNLVTCPSGPGGFSQIAELAVFVDVAPTLVAMVASQETLSTSPASGAMDIYIANYVDLPTEYGGCSSFVNVTHLGRDGAVARDMAVSPDGSWIAYSANSGPSPDAGAPLDITSPTHIWLLSPATTDGGAPMPCGDATDPAFDDFGPQWFNGGQILVWTRAAHPPSSVPDATGGLWQADVDPVSGVCTNVRAVVSNGPTEAGALTVIAPANTTIACNVGAGRSRSDSTAVAAWGVALLAAGGAWRKRRRRGVSAPLPMPTQHQMTL